MITVVEAILAIAKAIPVIDSLIQMLAATYVNRQIDSMKTENRNAIKKALDAHDQREIEKALASQKEGQHSNVPDTVIVDNLPGV